MKIPLTFRLVFHGVRSVIRAGLLFFCAWLIFIPASAEERAALGAEENSQYPLGLRPMRSARAIVAVAPDRLYVTIAAVMGPEVTPLFVRIAMVQMAQGYVLPQSTRPTRPAVNQSDRDISGPRFIKVD